jgi:hypothetical protein
VRVSAQETLPGEDKDGFRELGILKATIVHQEFRVLRRALNGAVRKKFLPAIPCASVEFPVSIRGLFRGVQWCLRFLSMAAVLLASVSGIGAAQDNPKPDCKNDVQRCTPRGVSHPRQRNTSRKFVRKGEKPTGYSAIIAFEILESGNVAMHL